MWFLNICIFLVSKVLYINFTWEVKKSRATAMRLQKRVEREWFHMVSNTNTNKNLLQNFTLDKSVYVHILKHKVQALIKNQLLTVSQKGSIIDFITLIVSLQIWAFTRLNYIFLSFWWVKFSNRFFYGYQCYKIKLAMS